MKTNFLTVVALIATLNMAVAQTAADVLKKMDEVIYASKDQSISIKMTVFDKNGKSSLREAKTLQKGNDKRIFRFTSPAAQAGIGILSLPGDVMYLYMPAYEKERRIASSAKNQGFAGTDFNYDDMESKLYQEKYDAVSLKTENNNWVLELKPKSTNKTDYGKLIVTVGKDNNYPRKVQYFDKNGNQIKELNNTKIEKKGNYWVATLFEMKDIKKGTKTQMEFTSVEYDKGLKDDDFTVRKLIQK
ncbi:MAG TPA: outer membrane lipoprotein-sorting protein [Bacteroidales bacterium]|jgi:outer membrane lipoprotein-sorting protein|nr:outer membrane lipoprotein-sorting protein [Bacteroidales bacterium]